MGSNGPVGKHDGLACTFYYLAKLCVCMCVSVPGSLAVMTLPL